MDRVRKQRAPVRRAVTKAITALETELAKEAPDSVNLKTQLQLMEKSVEKLNGLDQELLGFLLDENTPQADYDVESEAIQEYEEKIARIGIKTNEHLFPVPVHQAPPLSVASFESASDGMMKRYKLPKIELKKFSGKLTEWLGWWAQFEKIDQDGELHATDKFQYLVQATKVDTKARDLVERYPQSDSNYPKVIKALKERFGQPKLLKQVYVRELISMISGKVQPKSEGMSLSSLFDKLDSHLRSLESLGVTVEQMVEFLFPMVESCIPDDILVAWQRSPYYGKDGSLENPPKNEMDYLMDFLKKEIDSEEQRNLAKAGFDGTLCSTEKKKSHFKKKGFLRDEESVPTAAGLFNGEAKEPCIFCEGQHESKKCFKARKMTLEVKKGKILEKRACFTCLKIGHMSKHCKNFVKCDNCEKKHFSLLCPEQTANKPQPKEPASEVATTHINLNCTSEIVLQTLMVNVRNKDTGKNRKIRVLIDNGSQRSYISKTAVEDIQIQPSETVVQNHILFGGTQVSGKVHQAYVVDLFELRGGFSVQMKMLDQTQICGNIPRVSKGSWMAELKRNKVWVNDLSMENSAEVEMLIGADNLGQILTGRIVHLTNGLIATETKFGWTLMGKLDIERSSTLGLNVINCSITSTNVSDLWNLEAIGICDPVEVKSRKENELAVKEHFMQTVVQDSDGRYSVNLPWTDGMKGIPNNRVVAEKRLTTATNKLISIGKFSDYDEIFNAWEREGFISQCLDENRMSSCHYLPHRAVYKPESKTTPIRPVFDASCKMGRSPSLNDCLEKGPNLLELIPAILHRFRFGRIGVISDVRKAFLMIQVNEEDRDFLRFLWWEDPHQKKLKIFRHHRVVFGLNCSPFLLGAVIEYHLGKCKDHRRPIAEKLIKSLYVDNAVTSVQNKSEYEELKEISTQLMEEAKMELRQWECSRDSSGQPVTTVLGLKWDKEEDSLFCDVSREDLPEKITKRVILSQAQKIFDPLGFLCPTMLVPKLMLQRTWAEKMGWDDELPQATRLEFVNWFNEMMGVMDKVRIPRNVTGGEDLTNNVQLHMFSDASKAAYATVVYLRVESRSGVSVQLLQAKTRVAPTNITTIPRLELLSCTIGARLLVTVKEALSKENIPTYCWSDSTTALAWINRNDDWGTFVGNRVREICTLTNANQWRHVPGILNPADLPSRGCNPLKLLESKWWEGPDWLKRNETEWPSGFGIVDEDLVTQEKKKGSIMTLTSQILANNLAWLGRHESFIKNVRILAMVLRFVNKLKKKSKESGIQPSRKEVNLAELKMFHLIQADVFPKDQTVISGLRVIRDKDGIIRVITKLTNRQDSVGFRYPVLLPSSHPLVDQLIREEHLFNCHAGAQYLMGKLRERCWVIHSRRAIKKVIHSCVGCRRFEVKSPCVPPAPLPEDRVKGAKAFEITGVDLAGPLTLKDKSKTWIVLFTCAVYRCVHLELLQSLSTEDFLMAFVRFCKRKRRPTTMYSDNGTNFVGAVNLFKSIDWKEVERRTQQHRIEWKFNPPSAPWWGGWWERLIRSVKGLLKRMLGFGKLTYVQLETCLCEVESVINNRPLTFVTEDQDDLIPLTPAMFIHDLPEMVCPEAKLLKINSLSAQVKNMRQLGDELRSRFREEYLSQLVQRGKDKKFETFNVGDVVLVGAENMKRINWPMARIVELKPGKDGKTRVAKVKTTTGVFIRPVQRLYHLEVSSKEETPPICPKVKAIGVQEKAKKVEEVTQNPAYTRSGRRVKTPHRYRQ